MPKAEIERATPRDARWVSQLVRQSDLDEFSAARISIPDMLLEEARAGRAEIGFMDDAPVGMFGIYPEHLLSDEANVWMVSTIYLPRYARAFLPHSRAWVQRQLETHSKLQNFVDARNTQAIKWLKWLGFRVAEQWPVDVHGHVFYYFSLERVSCAAQQPLPSQLSQPLLLAA